MGQRPFGKEDIRSLAESMAGTLPEEVIDQLEALCEGSPFMTGALLQGLEEVGALFSSDQGWQVDADKLSKVQSSRRAAVFLSRRFDMLPQSTLELLEVGALLGKTFDVNLAAAVAGKEIHQTLSDLREARRRQIVWADAELQRWTFVHNKLRETTLARLNAEARQRLHRKAGEIIESHDPGQVFELTYHFNACGDAERALPYALKAARRAHSQYDLENAQRQYSIAEKGLNSATNEIRLQVAEGLGDVLMMRGQYDDAEKHLQAAFSLADSPYQRSKIEGKLGDLHLRRGNYQASAEAQARALRLLGHRVPKNPLTLALFLLWEVLIQLLHTLFPSLFLSRCRREGADKALLALRHLAQLVISSYWYRHITFTLWTHLRNMNLAERYPPSVELGRVYGLHATVMATFPYWKRSFRYGEKALTISTQMGDLWGQGSALLYSGIALCSAGKNQAVEHTLHRAIQNLERAGDLWERNTALLILCISLLYQGNLRQAGVEVKRYTQFAAEIGDLSAEAFSAYIQWQVNPDPLVYEKIEEKGRQFKDIPIILQGVVKVQALKLFLQREPAKAIPVLEKFSTFLKRSGARTEFAMFIPAYLAQAFRETAANDPQLPSSEFRKLLRRAARAARKARFTGRLFPNHLPHALRESALIAAIQGRRKKARALFNKSLEAATKIGAQLEHAKTLLERGKVGKTFAWPDAEQDLEVACQALCEIGAFWALPRGAIKGPPS